MHQSNNSTSKPKGLPADIYNSNGSSEFLIVCEHASNYIPDGFENLGLHQKDLQSHVAWDPGAMAVAQILSRDLDAKLVFSGVSRLVYDCNRPPSASDAIPARSELFDIPGNAGLSDADTENRAADYYQPFKNLLAKTLRADANLQVLVTIHSFTPVFLKQRRDVEFGILHDSDSRLADAMLENAHIMAGMNVQRNAPYGPQDGVTHTLKIHGIANGLLNIMLEIRNDLIADAAQQEAMAKAVATLLRQALATVQSTSEVAASQC